MSPYTKLLSIIGLATLWLCFSSLWAERAEQDLKLPLNLFEKWPKGSSRRAEGITMVAIAACWPFVLTTIYLFWRVAQESVEAKSRWQRLPSPFGLHEGLRPNDRTVYRLFFLLLFMAVPLVQVLHFSWRFFVRAAPHQLFHWSCDSWFNGIKGPDRLYGGLSYFGWIPVLVILGLLGMLVLHGLLLRALFQRETRAVTFCPGDSNHYHCS